MRKILVALVLASAANSAFAVVHNQDFTALSLSAHAESAPSVQWGITQVSDVYDVSNLTEGTMDVFISSDKSMMDSRVSDSITVMCSGKPLVVTAGSAVVCQVAAGEKAEIMIKADQFKNGATGTYALVP